MAASAVRAESGYDAWLRYASLRGASLARADRDIPAAVAVAGNGLLELSARREFIRGVKGMLGRTMRAEAGLPKEDAVVIGTCAQLKAFGPQWKFSAESAPEGFQLKTIHAENVRYTVVAGAGDGGALYGAFALLRRIALGEATDALDVKESPYAPIRWLNHWDNLDGSIERGYGGRSIFWENFHARADLARVSDYGRMLASLGINACSLNNVNADPRILAPDFLPEIARVADAFRPWGVRTVISVDFGSPKAIGGLDTFDPLDPAVSAWWKSTFDRIYGKIPDLAGVIVKADSEGRAGPSAYGRTHADAANAIARALKPHGGIVLYRAFVYNHHLEWREPKNDRARAAYDIFHPLDGRFDDNVIVQIKNGPIDFQVREPVSPLFGGLAKTNEAIELQITQEYTGQQRHLCFLVPMWKEVLDFDTRNGNDPTTVRDLVSGKVYKRKFGGLVGVANAGMDPNWLAHPLATANLYGFGRLAWDPTLSSQTIAEEWTRLTFGNDSNVVS